MSTTHGRMGGGETVNVVYRPISPADIDAIARVHRRACIVAYAFMNWSYSEEEIRIWYGKRFAAWSWGLIAEMDRTPIGFAAVSGALLDQLFVDPDQQRKGIGSTMLTSCLDRTPPVGVLTVFEQNITARRFYERHGFVEIRRIWNEDESATELVYARHARPGFSY